jgi:hypothetical protein
MLSLKISLSNNQLTELRAKIKLESDSPENALPFESLIIEASPCKAENNEIQLRITNNGIMKNKPLGPAPAPGPTKIHWGQRLLNAFRMHESRDKPGEKSREPV